MGILDKIEHVCSLLSIMFRIVTGGKKRVVHPERTNVLIVGCGPVGATLANMLGQRGIRTIVIDKSLEIFPAPRAIAFDNDALRILQSIGVDETNLDRVKIPFVRMISPVFGEFARVNTAREIDTHPVQVTFYQPELEQLLRRKLEGLSQVVEVRLGCELLSFKETNDGIRAALQSQTGDKLNVEARFLVGADGANSLVRRLIGQDFVGKSFIEDWLIVDALDARMPIDHIEFICDPRRPTPHMPAPGGRQRWEFMLAKGETRAKMESDAALDRLLAPWGGLKAMKMERRAVYRFHARCADAFQRGPVLLVGDAAHITPPFLGQGLVSGLRDVFNLSWKLAAVVDGTAGAHTLQSYDVERRPHARSMISLARLMGKAVMPPNRAAAFLTHGTMRAVRMIPGLRGKLDDLGKRSKGRFRRGLFQRSRRLGKLTPGDILPQGWIVGPTGASVRSDGVLGQGFVLLGFGVDPAQQLGVKTRELLRTLKIAIVTIDPQTSPSGDELALSAQRGAIALVRPDKVVFGLAMANHAERMILSALEILRSPS